MLRITVVLVCLSVSFNGLNARHLIRRSNECQSDENGSGFVCPQSDGMFPNAICTKFWHCSNCLAYEKDCPANLYWNDAKQECDWPQNVPDSDCKENGDEEAPASTTQSPTTAPTEDNTTEGSTQGSGEGSSEGSTTVAQETTTAESETTTQGSNEETTTEENNETTTEESSDATSEASPDETTTEGQTTTDSATTQTEEETTSAATTTEGSDGEGTPDPSRPSCEKDGYYQHADCNKFWQCGNGIAYEMPCAPGTIWDQSITNCNHPENVKPFPENCTPNPVFRK